MKNQRRRCISILLTVILTVPMLLISGIPVFSGETETPIVPIDSAVEINGLNLILSGDIGLTYHVYVPKKYRDGTMELKLMDKEPITMNITDCPKDSNLRYTATYHLNAIELSEPVTLTVYDKDGNTLAQKSHSAEEYAKLLLGDKNATDAEKNIAKTLINYGHYAQLVCAETNGWVIGKDYAETTAFYAPTVDPSVFDGYEIEWKNRSASFRRFSMSLRLDDKTGIYLYFPLEEKPTVTVCGKAVDAVESKRMKNNYEVFIEGVNALHLEDEYEITVNDVTFTLSAFTYCHYAISHPTDANTIEAMRALYEFYQATVAYHTPAEAER